MIEFLNKEELLTVLLSIMVLTAVLCLLFSIINDNYSQVDRVWPIMPIIYTWIITLYPVVKFNEALNFRLLLSTFIISVWGFKQVYNFYRKGGYTKGGEDYRWAYLREKINPILFQLFNVFFIAAYQNILIFAFSSPGYIMYLNRNNKFNILDVITTLLILSFLIGEMVADQQQWNFQTEKRKLINSEGELYGEYKLGFISSGLFRYSRHPNFFCEIMIWWCYYFFSVASSYSGKNSIINSLLTGNWTIIGTILLTLLFQGSTWFTEKISREKYSAYSDYQKKISRIIPWIPDRKFNILELTNKNN